MTSMRMVALLTAAVGGISSGAAAQQQQQRRQVSLKEALQLTAQQGPDVAAARAQAAIAHAAVDRAWTAWQPNVAANGTYDHTNGISSIDLSPLGAFIHSLQPTFPANTFGNGPITIVGQNNWYGNLQLTQPLLTPQGLFGPGAASAGAEAADRGADEAREQVLLGTARAYLGLQGLGGLLDAAHEAEKVALRREEDAKARIAAGTDVEIALLRAQTETAQARAQIAALQGQIESLLPVLEAVTGEAIAPLPASAPPTALGAPAQESAQPWEQTYSVKSAQAAADAARKALRISQFSWMPSVAGIAKESYTSNEGFTGKNWTYDLMINVSLPIYDGGNRYAQLHEDQAKLQQAQAQLAAARAKARSSWIGAVANLNASQAVLRQSEAQAQLAARAQVQVEAAARAGVATSLDLSDADQKKFAAQSAAAQARADVQVRMAEIAAAEGRLYSAAQ